MLLNVLMACFFLLFNILLYECIAFYSFSYGHFPIAMN
jgi:hypothetical protein